LESSQKDLSAPKRIFETFSTREKPRCINMNATLTSKEFIQFTKSNKGFFPYTIFPVNKINVENFFLNYEKIIV
jgi:hypothetical protein